MYCHLFAITYVSVHIHVHMYNVHKYVHTFRHFFSPLQMAFIRTCTHVHVCTCTYMYVHVRVHVYTFSPLQMEVELMLAQKKTLGVSNLRFLPKTAALRAITNLGSKVNLSPSPSTTTKANRTDLRSINHQLLDLFHVLKFEKVHVHHFIDAHVSKKF